MKRIILALSVLTLVFSLAACVNGKTGAQEVVNDIVALSDPITLADEEAVDAIRVKYDALSAADKETVTNYSLLTDAEATIARLKSSRDAAQATDALIALIPSPVTAESGTAISAARASYDALAEDARALVTKLEILTAAEKTYHDLTANPVGDTIDMINALPAYDALTLADDAAVTAANASYDALTDEEKALVTNYATLKSATGRLNTLKIEAAEAEKAKEAARIAEAIHVELEATLPTKTSSDLTLSTSYTYEGKSYVVRWGTSDGNTMNIYGRIIQGSKDITVTLSYTIIVNTIKTSYDHEIIVTALDRAALTTGKVLSAYLYDGNYYAVSAADAATLDIVNYGFGTVTASLIPVVTLARIDEVLALRTKGVRVVLSLGGGGSESLTNWSDAASTAANRLAFAKACLEICQEYHFDGIDLDWEYPGYNTGRDTETDKANYTLLVKAIREQLDSYDSTLILSTAVPGGPWGYTRYDIASLNKYFDFFNLMTYDMQVEEYASHHAALYNSTYCYSQCDIASTVKIWHNGGADYDKLVVGGAFYGRVFTVASAGSNYGMKQTNTSSPVKTVMYTVIKNTWLAKETCTEHYDTTAQAAWCYDTATGTVISYDNATSLGAKCDYVNTAGVRGLMFWDYGSDRTDTLMAVLRAHRASLV